MPIDILLVEPHKKRREQLQIVLTTTGGFSVKAVDKFPVSCQFEYSLVLLPLNQENTFLNSVTTNIPYILTSAYSVKRTANQSCSLPNCLGVIAIEPVMAVAEKVRQLMVS